MCRKYEGLSADASESGDEIPAALSKDGNGINQTNSV